MKREDISLLAQLLTGMRDAVRALDVAVKKRDLERSNALKKEIMRFQNQIDSMI